MKLQLSFLADTCLEHLTSIGFLTLPRLGHLLSSYATWVVSLFSMLLCSLLLMLLIFSSHLGWLYTWLWSGLAALKKCCCKSGRQSVVGPLPIRGNFLATWMFQWCSMLVLIVDLSWDDLHPLLNCVACYLLGWKIYTWNNCVRVHYQAAPPFWRCHNYIGPKWNNFVSFLQTVDFGPKIFPTINRGFHWHLLCFSIFLFFSFRVSWVLPCFYHDWNEILSFDIICIRMQNDILQRIKW